MAIQNRGPELASVLGLFLGLTWLFVLLRVYVKTYINKAWGWDDTHLIIALIFFSAYCASSLTGIKYGTGRHITDIPIQDVPQGLYYWWLCELFYSLSTVFIRLSIAVLLLRICVKKVYKNIIYGTLVVIVGYSFYFFFLVLFQCSPVTYFWRQYEGEKGSCINPAIVPDSAIAHSVLSFIADWILGLLPVALIYSLQMNLRTKLSVVALLSLGLLAGIATMIRIPFIKVLSLTDDFLYATTDVAIWSTIEPGLGIVACGGATLRPLFRSFYNLSTRATNTSNWRTPRIAMGYMRNRGDLGGDGEELRKGGEGGNRKGSVGHTSTATSLGTDEKRGGNGINSGITVSKTIEVSRLYADVESLEGASTPGTPWPSGKEKRDERDMV